MTNEEAEKYKTKGNEALKNRAFEDAIKEYNKAVTLDPDNPVYYSNRAAAWAELRKWDNSLNDATKCVEKDPRFAKGYSRKGTALMQLGRFTDSRAAFQEGLVIDPNNAACKQGIAALKAPRAPPSIFSGNIGGMFERAKKSFAGSSRMQMYFVVLIGYMLYSAYTSQTGGSGSVAPASDEHLFGKRQFVAVKTRDGSKRRISFTVKGSGAGVLLLHQPGLSYETEMMPLLEKLGNENMRVLAIDLPCHGFSDCAGDDLDIGSILNELQSLWDYSQYSVVTSGASSRYIPELKAEKAVFVNPELSYPPKLQTVSQLQAFLRGPEAEESEISLGMIRDVSRFCTEPRYEMPELPPKHMDSLKFPNLWLAEEDVGASEHRTFMSTEQGKFAVLDVETQQDILRYIRPPTPKDPNANTGHEMDEDQE
eukprot:GEMP01027110.1.p1 GENE.GEMP01027110.1~~GEMP01027110.1.p1  ORF type:complete len:424 (+),score=107.28 GEMP01027110.1:100-1371(+)